MDVTTLSPPEYDVLMRYSHDDLLKRAVAGARPRRTRGYAARWTAVQDAFACGSTLAVALCRAYGLDPDERVRR